ncbi:unnamed protein product [Fusarium venenatum]|uniref:Transcription factor domain-containing protein n=1 Tax=Fusarium venenatum TaxID=56646 RepID=A0A2L2TPE3_9HYPO|nr:uncharacterized protein FVRRES_04193 [Fusarium venenatum]CEI67681.1 unnamed protein product [Fusarium venenatum]
MVIWLSHADEQVNRTWCIVGQVYAARSGKEALNRQQRDGIYQALASQTAICARGLKQSSTTMATVPLLCASLLAVTDLLLDDTGDHWRTRMACISESVGVMVNDDLQLAPLDRELIRLFQLNDVLGSVSRQENPLGPNFSEAILKTRCTSKSTESFTSCTLYDYVLSAMWKWSVLQKRCLKILGQICLFLLTIACRIIHWVGDVSYHHGDNTNNDDDDDNSKNLSLEDKIEGIELIDEATRLQSFLLRVLLLPPSPSKPNYQYLDPYCRWMLVSISQVIQHQVMTGLECDLPVMPPTCLQQQALAALDDIEKITTNSALDIGFFLPVVDAVSTGIASAGDHARLLHFLENVEARGYGIAREYRQEVLDKANDF